MCKHTYLLGVRLFGCIRIHFRNFLPHATSYFKSFQEFSLILWLATQVEAIKAMKRPKLYRQGKLQASSTTAVCITKEIAKHSVDRWKINRAARLDLTNTSGLNWEREREGKGGREREREVASDWEFGFTFYFLPDAKVNPVFRMLPVTLVPARLGL